MESLPVLHYTYHWNFTRKKMFYEITNPRLLLSKRNRNKRMLQQIPITYERDPESAARKKREGKKKKAPSDCTPIHDISAIIQLWCSWVRFSFMMLSRYRLTQVWFVSNMNANPLIWKFTSCRKSIKEECNRTELDSRNKLGELKAALKH